MAELKYKAYCMFLGKKNLSNVVVALVPCFPDATIVDTCQNFMPDTNT